MKKEKESLVKSTSFASEANDSVTDTKALIPVPEEEEKQITREAKKTEEEKPLSVNPSDELAGLDTEMFSYGEDGEDAEKKKDFKYTMTVSWMSS